MASDAVILHYFFSRLFDENDLRFSSESKHSGMSQSILRLEIILVKHIVMRDMTVVAIGLFPVGTVIPGGVLRGHDMAVHAGGRIVGQV